MSIVQDTDLPTFQRLRDTGVEVLDVSRAQQQDIRELHIGVLNLMPDAALEATERQFFRLIGSCNRIAQFHVHPFTMTGVERGVKAQQHIDKFYRRFDWIKKEGLDALIITGANPAKATITDEGFWHQILEVIEWANTSVCSTFFSCFATHVVMHHYFGTERIPLKQKRWGVYSHRVCRAEHPLVNNINTRFDAPHSHVYDINCQQAQHAGWHVLAKGEVSGLYLAVSHDGFRQVYCQGHPEYDINSLLKEYKREVSRYVAGVRARPPLPEGYFSTTAQQLLNNYLHSIDKALAQDSPAPDFPEASLLPLLDNTWSDTGRAIFNNWLGLVYQLTHHNRLVPFMRGVDPDNPLGFL